MDLLERFAFLGRAIKNAGTSAKEAAEAFKKVGEIMSQERPDDDVGRYNNGTPHVCPHCMKRTSWRSFDYETMYICDKCAWRFDAHALVNNHFAELRSQALELELRQRDVERDRLLNESINEVAENIRRRQAQIAPGTNPTMRRTPSQMSVRERLIRAQELVGKRGSLTEDELQELTEIAAFASNQHPESTGRSGSFRRAQFPSIAPLRGVGVVGDEILMGNEETFNQEYMQQYVSTTDHVDITTSPNQSTSGRVEGSAEMTPEMVRELVEHMERVQDERFLTPEMYEGFGFGGGQKVFYSGPEDDKEKKVEPRKPLKRKLDL